MARRSSTPSRFSSTAPMHSVRERTRGLDQEGLRPTGGNPGPDRRLSLAMVSAEPHEHIDAPYLLVTFVRFFVDDEGAIWLDPLWSFDLIEHTRYLAQLTVAAPCVQMRERDGLVRLSDEDAARFRIAALPPMGTWREAMTSLPSSIRTLWREVGAAELVHSSIAGWPIPVGWIANAIAIARQRTLIVNVESAPWRVPPGQRASVLRRLRAWGNEMVGGYFARRAHVAFFTHEGYRRELRGSDGGHVLPASWLRETDVVDDDSCARLWDAKGTERVRVLFAGRFVHEKGVPLLLDAHARLRALGAHERVHLDVVGSGPLLGAVRAAQCDSLRLLEPVPHGPLFNALLDRRHAIVVPTVSDEQPRILLDAAARAVPAVASDTEGNRVLAGDDDRIFFARGDADALADALASLTVADLRRRGRLAVQNVRGHTHRAMHRRRFEILRPYSS